MKLKSLLIGSAAILAASSAARAADAIVVEPEPVEYVRVCDMYGTGFFYIPGTETCIKFDGYVRSTYATGHTTTKYTSGTFNLGSLTGNPLRTPIFGPYTFGVGTDSATWTAVVQKTGTTTAFIPGVTVVTPSGGIFAGTTITATTTTANNGFLKPVAAGKTKNNWHSWTYRARFNIDVRNETEYGTLRSYIRFQAGDTNTMDGNAVVDQARIELAGFRLGYGDSAWDTSHAGSPAIYSGFRAGPQGLYFDYTWQSDALAVTVGFIDVDSGGPNFGGTTAATGGSSGVFYAAASYAADFGTFTFVAAQNNEANMLKYYTAGKYAGTVHSTNDADWTYSINAKIPLADSGWTIGGWYDWSDNPYSALLTQAGVVPGTTENWGIWVSGNLSDNLSAYAMYSAAKGEAEIDNLNALFGFGDTIAKNSGERWALGVIWTPVSQLSVQAEYFSQTNTTKMGYAGLNLGKLETETDGFAVRVTRSF